MVYFYLTIYLTEWPLKFRLKTQGEGIIKKEEDDFVRSGVEMERPLSRDVVLLRAPLILLSRP